MSKMIKHDDGTVEVFYTEKDFTSDHAVVGEVTPIIAKYGDETVIECECSNIFLKRHHLYCYKCGAKLNWRNFA